MKRKPKDRVAFIDFRDAQRVYATILADGWETGGAAWLVSDYVTLGSPLSKAEILITRNRERFDFRVGARGLPTCPPFFEQTSPPRFSYEVARGQWGPHHAAPFASTSWTNLYFSNTLIVIGDIVSGLVAPLFGPGVRDVRLPIGAPKFRHNDYWLTPEVEPTPPWIKALRHALNLRLAPETQVWDQTSTDTMLADRPNPKTPKA